MGYFGDLLDDWRDPEHVWNFQQYFGVQKLRQSDPPPKPGAPYTALEADSWKRRQALKTGEAGDAAMKTHRRTKSADSGIISSVSSDDNEDNAEDRLSVANASMEDVVETENVIFYRIGNWFWHYLFLFGTQLGDEAYYSIFLTFWFWNIDGAVGRRVVMVWNLVMYIGEEMGDAFVQRVLECRANFALQVRE